MVSGSGTEKVYRFYGMIYPEFKTLTIGGGEAVLTRSAYYQDLLTYRGTGTTLEFTLDDDVRLLADGKEVASGSTIRSDATYTLVRTHPHNTGVVAITRVSFE